MDDCWEILPSVVCMVGTLSLIAVEVGVSLC